MCRLVTLLLLACIPFNSGCQSAQVAHDGKGLRQALLDIYTDQAMDNLIRAHNGQAFVQLAYRDLLVQDVDSLSASIQDGLTTTNTRNKGVGGVLTSAVHTVTNVATFGAFTGKRDKTMSFHADIITDKNDIYETYLSFATNSQLFVVSDVKPPCPVHIMRECGGKYYFVPVEAGGVFQQLLLKTTFMRGPEKAPPPDFYQAKIVAINELLDENGKPIADADGDITRVIVFDREIPNGPARMVVTLDDQRKITKRLEAMDQLPVAQRPAPGTPGAPQDKSKPDKQLFPPPKQPQQNTAGLPSLKGPKRGDPTNSFYLTWNPVKEHFTDINLVNAASKVYSNDYPPPAAPAPSVDLQRLNDNLDIIRANISNNNSI